MASKVCAYFVFHCCTAGTKCQRVHDKTRTKQCTYFAEGKCRSGDDCKFAHIPATLYTSLKEKSKETGHKRTEKPEFKKASPRQKPIGASRKLIVSNETKRLQLQAEIALCKDRISALEKEIKDKEALVEKLSLDEDDSDDDEDTDAEAPATTD